MTPVKTAKRLEAERIYREMQAQNQNVKSLILLFGLRLSD
jgi:hypothetical protein